jgi:hypothetical protein
MSLVQTASMLAVGAATIYMSVAVEQSPALSGQEMPLFSISKSENKNQVQYAMKADARCTPAPGEPIYAYWRMLELGSTRTAPLLSREIPAYGIMSQRVLERGPAGGRVQLTLRAMPSRPILVETSLMGDGTCQAWSTMTIGGAAAHLYNVHVKLRWPIGVDYVLLQGWSMDGKRLVTETIKQ